MKETYRIANWNLERPLKPTKKIKLAIQKIKEINPDICILTETSSLVHLGEEYFISQTKEFADSPGEQWSAIWSKWPITKEIQTFDPRRATCALIASPFGDIIIYATIIPYHNAGVIEGGKYSYAPKKYSVWQMHKEDIILQGDDWLRISADHPGIPLCVAGDFNQTRDGKKGGYGTNETRDLLTKTLEICHLSCVTNEDFGENGKLNPDPRKGTTRRNIDHICISKNWDVDLNNLFVGAWDNFTEDGTYMTDHNGVYLEFSMN